MPNPRYLQDAAAAAAAAAVAAAAAAAADADGANGDDPSCRAPAGDPVTPAARMIVVSWLVEVAEEFGLQPETLHLSVSLLDRFLAAAPGGAPRGVLQMVAVACVMLAAKDLEVRDLCV